MDAYDEQVADAEHEAVRQIINWWRNLRPEATSALVTRIREELPALVDPERFDANRDPFEILETILRDRRPEGGRDAYTRILRRLLDDAGAGEQLPVRPWSVQVGDAGFRSNTVGVEARTIEQACLLAREKANDDPDGWKNVGVPSDSFIDAISAGRNVDPWQDGWENVPRKFSQDFVLGGGTPGEDDERPAPDAETSARSKKTTTPANDAPDRARPETDDDDARAPERVWLNGETTIDLVRMLDRGKSHMPGEFHIVVVWHGATHTTAVDLDEADRHSLHEAFAAYVRHRATR